MELLSPLEKTFHSAFSSIPSVNSPAQQPTEAVEQVSSPTLPAHLPPASKNPIRRHLILAPSPPPPTQQPQPLIRNRRAISRTLPPTAHLHDTPQRHFLLCKAASAEAQTFECVFKTRFGCTTVNELRHQGGSGRVLRFPLTVQI